MALVRKPRNWSACCFACWSAFVSVVAGKRRQSPSYHFVVFLAGRCFPLSTRFGFHRVDPARRDDDMIDVPVRLHRHVVKDAAAVEHQLVQFFRNRSFARGSESIISPPVNQSDHPPDLYREPPGTNEYYDGHRDQVPAWPRQWFRDDEECRHEARTEESQDEV